VKILGISGVHGLQEAHAIKNKISDYRDLRIVQGLDSACALVSDGEIIFATSEERYLYKKGTGEFPTNCLSDLLKWSNINYNEIDKIAWCFNPEKILKRGQSLESQFLSKAHFEKTVSHYWPSSNIPEIVYVDHHLAHAHSTIKASGLVNSLVVIADGMGERESISIYHLIDGELNILKKYPVSQSIGIVYSIITRFLGFCFNQDEYKVMGMSAYGKPGFGEKLDRLIKLRGGKICIADGVIQSNDPLLLNAMEALETYLGIPRITGTDDWQQQHYDLALALQRKLESVMNSIIQYWMTKTSETNLCGAGGVFLNCLMNQHLIENIKPNEFFVQPASGDDGAALGAALSQIPKFKETGTAFTPYLGRAWSKDEVGKILKDTNLHYIELPYDAYIKDAEECLAQGKVIAWFNGRTEYGPRALGNRSILANPGIQDIQDTINRKIKFREGFRPFAPSFLEEEVGSYVENWNNKSVYKYMLATVFIRENKRTQIPGVVHKDGTARIQSVSPELNPTYYDLISSFYNITGIPCLLNTSFNVAGQPLINDPTTAFLTFEQIDIDILYIEGMKVWKC